MDWGFRIDRDGTITPDQGLSEAQLLVLEAKLKVALARVQLMSLEKRLRTRVQPVDLGAGRGAAIGEGAAVAPYSAEITPEREKLLLRVTEVTRLLSISRSGCYALISTGELPAIKLGKSLRVSRAALNSWLESRND